MAPTVRAREAPVAALPDTRLAMPQPIYRYHAYQGNTNHCGPYCVAIAANSYLGEARFDPLVVARQMNRPLFKVRPLPHWVIARLPNGPSFPWGMATYLTLQGIPARCRWWGDEALLLRNLWAGAITIVFIGNLLRFVDAEYRGWAHAKVLYGFDPARGYAFVDPGYEADPQGPSAQHGSPNGRCLPAAPAGQAGCRALGKPQGISWQSRAGFMADWRQLGRPSIVVG